MLLISSNKKGISTIEILIVVAIVVTAFVAFLGVASFNLKVSNLIKETTQANKLAQEVVEVVRSFRDKTTWDTDGLGTLTAGVAYYPQKTTDTPPSWNLTLVEETINIFTRKVVFENVMRDANDDIVESGGVNDSDTKKATITVSWKDKQIEIVTYFTNWRQ